LTIFDYFACAGGAYFLSNSTKVPKNAGSRRLGLSFAQRYPQIL
jgi:hypothetical protein